MRSRTGSRVLSVGPRNSARLAVLVSLLFLVGFSGVLHGQSFGKPAATGTVDALPLIEGPDLSGLEPSVATQLRLARRRAVSLHEEMLRALTEGAPPDVADSSLEEEATEALGNLARLYHTYGYVEAAAPLYRALQERGSEDFRWPHLFGLLLRDAGDLEHAAVAFQTALERQPDNRAAALHLGRILFQLGRLDEAEETLASAITPDVDPALLAFLGEVALAKGEPAEAIALLSRALEIVPSANRLHYPLAQAHRALGDPGRAKEHLTLAGKVGLRPIDPLEDGLAALQTGERAHTLRARRALSAGDHRSAVREFRAAARVAPESSGARVNLAAALSHLGQVEAAEAELREALRIAPQNQTAHFNLAALLEAEGDCGPAIWHYEQSLGSDLSEGASSGAAEDQEARLGLARCLLASDQLEAGRLHLEFLRRLDEPRPEAWLLEAQALIDAGFFQRATKVLEQAYEALPAALPVSRTLARWYAVAPVTALRDGERALELASKVVESNEEPESFGVVALALAELGRCDEAARWTEEAIARCGDSDRALRERLERQRARLQSRPCESPLLE